MAEPGESTVVKTMGISHREFFRSLPQALDDPYEVAGERVRVEGGGRRLDISLAPEGERRIASIAVPVTEVTLRFRGYADDEIAAVLARFDRAFQRGGG